MFNKINLYRKQYENKKRSIFLGLDLSVTALVWGLSLSAQSQGMKYLSPNYFNAFSSILGGIALLPIAFLMVLDIVKIMNQQFLVQ